MSKNKFPSLSGFPDCMGLSINGRCSRLTVTHCLGEKCTFKQTRQEDFESIQGARQRISSLNWSTQSHIAKKYYRGNMPWTEIILFDTEKV